MNTIERIALAFPIEHDGLKIGEIGLRRPTVGDHLLVAKLNLSDAEREVRLIANLAELPPEAVMKLDLKDYAAIQKALAGFLS
ncbi:MAG: phage tail assembly protein [Rhodocyclaceae bacterium]|nr:phage tail assembly protein [Rhodocyclaceae bacterium]